ncbi:uncharacterized protein LOC119564413 isoform X1 [Chelonia mydas]|uniref:uncharacterized protein LOC119564413 isoform X1 n=1 Tax=Chelonia mydas TaxID=8469 RepID=UPI001CA80EEB|nr:uncharacterized protein LOC119564413 isoform X1 [Chelonia mydas]
MAPSSAAAGHRAAHCACAEPSRRRRLGSALAGRCGRRRARARARAGAREAAAAPPGKPAARLAQRGAGPRSPPEGGRPPAKASLRRRFSPSSAAPPVGPSMLRPSGDPGRGRLKARKPGAAVPLRDSGLSAAVWALATAAPSYPRLFSLPGCMPGRGCSQASFSPSLCRCSMAQVHPLQTKGLPKLFKKTAVAVNEACSGGSSGFCACNFLSRQAQQHLRHLLFLVTDCLVNWSETRSSIKGKEGQSII